MFKIKLKEDVKPGFIVETDNIRYTLTNDVELDATTNDSLKGKVSNESLKEDNPKTSDKNIILFILVLLFSGTTLYVFSKNENYLR